MNSYNQILKNIGIGYVLGRTNATQKGFSYGFYNVEYKAFSLSLKNNFINDRLFPNSGLKLLIPREFFILNKNLDAISALIILEDYCKMKFTLNQNIDSKTWLK